jgi:hypothetical protein
MIYNLLFSFVIISIIWPLSFLISGIPISGIVYFLKNKKLCRYLLNLISVSAFICTALGGLLFCYLTYVLFKYFNIPPSMYLISLLLVSTLYVIDSINKRVSASYPIALLLGIWFTYYILSSFHV